MMRVLIALVASLAALAAAPGRAATEIQVVTSDGGITAWLVEERSIPMLALDIFIEGGALLEPEEALGSTRMMMGLLEEGAGNYDSVGFARAADALGARFGFGAGMTGVDISATVLTENRSESLALLALALNQPSFPADAIERVRAQALSGLASAETDPGSITSRAFAKTLYGDHPMSRPLSGTVETVEALDRDDLIAAHRRSLVRDRLTIGVVGDISADELGPLLDKLFAGLPESDTPLPAPAEVYAGGGQQIIDFPSPESIARFGQPGIKRNDPDYLAAYVAAQIFGGGGVGSRLNEEVREKRGLTYGIFAGLSPSKYGSRIIAQVSTANDNIAEAVEVVRAEWARLAAEGVTAEELEKAKLYLTGAYPLQFDGNGRIAGILVGMQLADLDPGYPARRNALVEALTLEEVNAVIARVFRPEAVSVLIVGQPEGLAATQ